MTPAVANPLDHPRLAEIAIIVRLCACRLAGDVIEMGMPLKEAKAILKDSGQERWLDWLAREFAWDERTAQRYMSVSDLAAKYDTVSDLNLPLGALYLLAAKSTPPEAQAEVIARAEAGEPVTAADVKAAIAAAKEPEPATEPEPEPEPTAVPVRTEPEPKPRHGINAAVIPLFKNEDRLDAFCAAVTTRAAKRFISLDQQLELAKDIIKQRVRAQHIESWISSYVRHAARAQGKIDEIEEKDFYKQFPGHEIRDEVAAVQSTARSLTASLFKLEKLFARFPHHPFFGDLGSTLDGVINMIRQWRRAAGEDSADDLERKLSKLQEFERKIRTLEITITELRRENEELREKLAAEAMGTPR